MSFKILVIDGEADSRKGMRLGMQLHGFRGSEIETRGSGENVVNAHLAEHYDAIIADWHAPDVVAAELCRRLKDTKEPPAVIIIGPGYRKDEAEAAGADLFVLKVPDVFFYMKISSFIQALAVTNEEA